MSTKPEPKLGVLIIHGIGHQKISFADKFKHNLNKYLNYPDNSNISMETSYWSPILDEKEILFENSISKFSLSYSSLRKFVLFYIGDVLAYQRSSYDNGSAYRRIHSVVRESFERLLTKIGPKGKIVIVGHSLGSVIASDFIWDNAGSDLHSKIGGLVTLGSPLLMYSLAYTDPKAICIGNNGSPSWLNIYSNYDVLSYPVSSIYRYKNNIGIEDKHISVGSLFTCWNPLSHSYYFQSKAVAKYIANYLVNK